MAKVQELYKYVKRNEKYGFFELKEEYRKPMKDFYRKEYYQDEHALYKNSKYDFIDIKQKENFFAQKQWIADKIRGGACSSFLDIGAGEGYSLAYFHKMGFDVTGIDLSSHAIKIHNPLMEKYFQPGDYEELIEKMAGEGKTFDFINADCFLEHLPDPEKFFCLVKRICHKKTAFCVTVPNDFSKMQSLSYEMGKIDGAFWVSEKTSEHFSYFSVETLCALGENFGFQKVTALGDWPIDFFLLHNSTNYRKEPDVGHDCHIACAALENMLYDYSMEKTIHLFVALAKAGIGRHISVYFRLK